MLVLVAYGSTRGGTAALARMIAEDLEAEGFTADVRSARHVGGLEGYDAVIVGGALYAGRWHRDARRFVTRFAGGLRGIPTYLFSSGPLDNSAGRVEIPPVRGVASLMGRVGSAGHATFGGRLAPDTTGLVARAMAKKHAGNWQDPNQVRTWVHQVASDLRASVAPTA
jgi:menaquinone-dependent protoporphyrinogen oxidase